MDIFTELITNSLVEVAPFGVIILRSNFKFGLSSETKEIMKKRDEARSNIRKTTGNEKQLWNQKYKKLRNSVTSKTRKETLVHNNKFFLQFKPNCLLWDKRLVRVGLIMLRAFVSNAFYKIKHVTYNYDLVYKSGATFN